METNDGMMNCCTVFLGGFQFFEFNDATRHTSLMNPLLRIGGFTPVALAVSFFSSPSCTTYRSFSISALRFARPVLHRLK